MISCTRVHSLTARTIPRRFRENLQKAKQGTRDSVVRPPGDFIHPDNNRDILQSKSVIAEVVSHHND